MRGFPGSPTPVPFGEPVSEEKHFDDAFYPFIFSNHRTLCHDHTFSLPGQWYGNCLLSHCPALSQSLLDVFSLRGRRDEVRHHFPSRLRLLQHCPWPCRLLSALGREKAAGSGSSVRSEHALQLLPGPCGAGPLRHPPFDDAQGHSSHEFITASASVCLPCTQNLRTFTF